MISGVESVGRPASGDPTASGDLASGWHFFRSADGRWVLHGPDDRVVRVGGADVVLAAARRCLEGVGGGGDRDTAAPVLARLAERGLLVDSHAPARPPTGVVLIDRAHTGPADTGPADIEGRNPVADRVAELLRGVGVEVRDPGGDADEAAVSAVDAVVSCVGWLPDTRWVRLDEWCARRGTPWHRSHRDGDRWYLGPLAGTPGAPSYRDTRGRRLAASALPTELESLWRHLESPDARPVGRPSPATAAALAGLLVNDVLAVLSGAPVPGAGYEIAFDPETATLHRHPVLPLPTLRAPQHMTVPPAATTAAR